MTQQIPVDHHRQLIGPRATVVIVNYNGYPYVQACLNALRGDPEFDLPIVVVDNASHDNSVSRLSSEFPSVRFIAAESNLGFAAGNNRVLRELDTPFVILLNPDTIPQPGALNLLIDFLDDPSHSAAASACAKVVFIPKFAVIPIEAPSFFPGGADSRELGIMIHAAYINDENVFHQLPETNSTYRKERTRNSSFKWARWTKPSAEIIIPIPESILLSDEDLELRLLCSTNEDKIVSINGIDHHIGANDAWLPPIHLDRNNLYDVINSCGGYMTNDGFGGDVGFWTVDRDQYQAPREVFSGGGSAVAIRTSCGDAVDWFDDDLFLYYEDTDLAWRLRLCGWKNYAVPKAVVRHHHSVLTNEGSDFWLFHVERNRVLILLRNATWPLAGTALRSYLKDYGRYGVETLRLIIKGKKPGSFRFRVRTKVLVSLIGRLPSTLMKRARDSKRNSVGRSGVNLDWDKA